MNRRFSFSLTVLALLISLFLVYVISTYYPYIVLSVANTLTKIIFGMICGAGVLCTIILILFQRWVYAKRKELFLSLSSFLFGIVCIIAVFQIIDNKQLRFSPHQYLNYVGTPNYKSPDGLNMHNSLGFRGPEIEVPKPKGRIRIAVLGGSTAYEDFVKDWKQDFARRLQYELRRDYPKKEIEVINAGLPGWDSWEDLINLEFRLIDLNLDLVILYEGTNEVHARLVRPEAYKADNSGNKKQWERKPCLDIKCLKLVQRITGLDAYTAPTAVLYPLTNDYNPVLGMTSIQALAKNPPIYSERNLRNIIAIARENNIKVMLATWAWSDQIHDYAATSHYQLGFRDENNVIKKVAQLKNVPIYNFASEMPMDKKYWGDGRHNNREGIELKAKLFANFIVKNNILEK